MSTSIDLPKLVAAIREATCSDKDFVGLHEPIFVGKEKDYVVDCLETGWVSSVGRYVDQFEQMMADITGSVRAVAVINGTAALHMCLLLSEVRANDEVICPALSFIATANPIAYIGAIPHFADVGRDTLGLDPDKLECYLQSISTIQGDECFNKVTGRRIKAVIAMHTFGHPVKLDRLQEVCLKYKLELVEDAAESLGSHYKGRHTGTWSKLAAVSFNGNKIVTTGGGGVILVQDEELGKLAKHLTTTAKVPHKWEFVHDHVGYNYRLPNLNAALGCAQLEQLPAFLASKRTLAERYRGILAEVEGVTFFDEPKDSISNYWLNTILLNEVDKGQRDEVLKYLNDNGLMARPAWTLLHKLNMYEGCPRMDLEASEDLAQRIINIPSSTFLGGNHE
ncbi:LegC family aminotransferase [Cohnella sp. GCM10027633]|uniref:LegC family aminotransferase n=1 Tax=unclassified Cohnella TaxID=2636738 RepID=UPI00363ADDD1